MSRLPSLEEPACPKLTQGDLLILTGLVAEALESVVNESTPYHHALTRLHQVLSDAEDSSHEPAAIHKPTLRERISALLKATANETRPCRACGAKVYFVRHVNGQRGVYTEEGISHYIDCPNASEFRRKHESRAATHATVKS